MRTITLEGAPHLAPLLARATLTAGARTAWTAGGRGRTLPDTEVVRRGVVVDRGHLAAYDRVCGYSVRDRLPSTYLHVLSFGLQTVLMAQRDFPLDLPGLVHVASGLTLRQPVDATQPLDLSVRAEGLRPHPRGVQVDLVAQAWADGDLVWTGRSSYLAKEAAAPETAARELTAPGADAPETAARSGSAGVPSIGTEGPPQARWVFQADAGRRYAAVSGDINPIHLSALTARAFGFPRAIAHGMWTAARCLAALEPRIPVAHEVEVAFRRPVLLPSRVELRTRRDDDGWRFGLTAAGRGDEHLRGVVRRG